MQITSTLINRFTATSDDRLTTAVDEDVQFANLRPGSRRQLVRLLQRQRHQNHADANAAWLEQCLATAGKTGHVEYRGQGNFHVHINGIDPASDAAAQARQDLIDSMGGG